MRSTAIRSLFLFPLVLGVCGLTTSPSFAQQSETAVNCDEGVIAEPVAISYGDHTVDCAIGSAGVDSDRFIFSGSANDEVRILVHGLTGLFDPALEVRNPVGTVVATLSCLGGAGGCSFVQDVTLDQSGNYQIAISDVGVNEAGNYTLQVERLVPAPNISRLDYDSEAIDAISPTTDTDHYRFNGSPGTDVRIFVVGTTGLFDPTLEVRDPTGSVVIDGAVDGAACQGGAGGCSFFVDLAPGLSGDYSVVLYDGNEAGGYQIGLACLYGPCESIAGTPDPDPSLLSYDAEVVDSIGPAIDADVFSFNGSPGTDVRISVVGTTGLFDPIVEVRDPTGAVVVDGAVDGAACQGGAGGCSFSVDLSPALSGDYSVVLYDGNEAGGYEISLWCLFGSCESIAGIPDPDAPILSYVLPIIDAISPRVDGDFFRFNGSVGTDVRINVSGTTGLFDPRIEVREPDGDVAIDAAADGAACQGGAGGCSFSVDLSPAESGTYTVLIYDGNEAGGYEISLWCLLGDCDSDFDGLPDGDRQIVDYGDNLITDIGTDVDGDFYVLSGTAGDQVRFNVNGTTGLFDPTLECRDPNGAVVLNGAADGASCQGGAGGCSFSVDLLPAITGTYTCAIYDSGTNEAGGYQLGLQCLFGTCANLTPPLVCVDNCSIEPNGPLMLGFNGDNQRDTNGDGIGNICDPDFNGNGIVDPADFSLLKSRFGQSGFPDQDFNGNGIVDPFDFSLLKSKFGQTPGPSCAIPNTP